MCFALWDENESLRARGENVMIQRFYIKLTRARFMMALHCQPDWI